MTGVVLDQVQGKNPAGNIIGSVATSEDVNFTEPAPRKNYHVTGLVVRRSSLGGVTTIGGDVSIFNCKLTFGAYARTGSIIAQGGGQDTNLRGARITCSQCVVGGLTDGFGTSSIKLPNTASFTNCIVLGPAGTGPENGQTVSGSVLFNNAANYPGNRTTSDPNAFSEVFVTNNISGAGLADSLYRLNTNPSNPARGAGVGGGDAGMFAGAQPYQLSGIPARPRVTHLSTSGVVSDTVGLSVQAGGEVRP